MHGSFTRHLQTNTQVWSLLYVFTPLSPCTLYDKFPCSSSFFSHFFCQCLLSSTYSSKRFVPFNNCFLLCSRILEWDTMFFFLKLSLFLSSSSFLYWMHWVSITCIHPVLYIVLWNIFNVCTAHAKTPNNVALMMGLKSLTDADTDAECINLNFLPARIDLSRKKATERGRERKRVGEWASKRKNHSQYINTRWLSTVKLDEYNGWKFMQNNSLAHLQVNVETSTASEQWRL